MITNSDPFSAISSEDTTTAATVKSGAADPFSSLSENVIKETANNKNVNLKKVEQDPFYKQEYKDPLGEVRETLKTTKKPNADEAVSTMEWLASLVLLMIPIVNLISLILFMLSDNSTASKKNWAKATLILWVISAVLLFIFFILCCTVWFPYVMSLQ